MAENFQKPFIERPGILDSIPGDPEGYVTNDGMWAAVPYGKKFIIIHNGQQVHVSNNYKAARTYITKEIKASKKKTTTVEQFFG